MSDESDGKHHLIAAPLFWKIVALYSAVIGAVLWLTWSGMVKNAEKLNANYLEYREWKVKTDLTYASLEKKFDDLNKGLQEWRLELSRSQSSVAR